MKIKLILNSEAKLKISVDEEEAKQLENIWIKIGLEKRRIYNFLGKNIEIDAWVDTSNSLLGLLNGSVLSILDNRVLNDLNSSIIGGDYINIGFLRIFDSNNKEVEIKLDKLLTIKEFKNFIDCIRSVFERLLNLVLDEVEIKINKKNDK